MQTVGRQHIFVSLKAEAYQDDHVCSDLKKKEKKELICYLDESSDKTSWIPPWEKPVITAVQSPRKHNNKTEDYSH